MSFLNEKNVMRGAVVMLAVGVGVLAYNQSRARADGIPAVNPMVYSGTLEDGGRPAADGTRNFRLTVWDDATSAESSRIRCITMAPGTMVTGGRFQIALDNACTAAVRGAPDLWIEVEVGGTSLGRTKIGAVPYAVEAARASELTPAARNSLVPVGTVIAYAGRAAPAGWLLCDGRAVNRMTYSSLFDVIGGTHGTGDGTTTFNLPDYRGRFLRGVDSGAGRDPDRGGRVALAMGGNVGDNVGTLQPFATAMPGSAFVTGRVGDHNHSISAVGDHVHAQFVSANPNTGGSANRVDFDGDVSRASAYSQGINTGGAGGHNHTLGAAGAHDHPITGGDRETRPANVSVNYLIKF